MKVTVFNENDSVLLVGEGNFSFSVALHHLHLKINLTASCYETCIEQETTKKNIKYLVTNGIRVLTGVDATKLMEHPILKLETFNKIIFNFPHVGGKMKITKNRELLKQFFISIEKLIKIDGQILITLCNGQGGTDMDNPRRRWDDSWKIIEMAAHGNFILTAIQPFAWPLFQAYSVTGYRSLDKQFNTTGALTHIFIKSEPPNIQNIAPNCKIDFTEHKMQNILWKDIISKIRNVLDSNIHFMQSPTFSFDITFSIDSTFNIEQFYRVLANYAGNIIDNVEFIQSYVFPSKEKLTHTYKIYYKSHIIPLYRRRVIDLHQILITNLLEDNLNVIVSR